MRRAVATVLLALASACTANAGTGFGSLEEASLDAEFAPGGRLGDDGSFLVMGGYRVMPETMSLSFGEVRLDELVTTGGGSGAVFDPANPPPGYSLCHAGHCHHDDGRLVDYEEIQAELSSGGTSEYQSLVSVVVDDELDLLAAAHRQLDTFLPSGELREGTVSRVTLDVGRLRMTGTVTGGDFGEERLPIRVNVGIDGVLATLEVNREVSIDAEPSVSVAARVPVAATFLDGQSLSSAVEDGEVVIAAGAIADAVALSLLSTPLGVELQ